MDLIIKLPKPNVVFGRPAGGNATSCRHISYLLHSALEDMSSSRCLSSTGREHWLPFEVLSFLFCSVFGPYRGK